MDILEVFEGLVAEQRKKSRRGAIIIFFIFSAIIIGGTFIPAKNHTEEIWKTVILGFFFGIMVLTIILSVLQYRLHDPEDSRILEAIRYGNADSYFCWIYPYKHVYNGGPSYFLMFMSTTKKKYQLSVKNEHQFNLIEQLQPIIRNVTYGYHENYAQDYKRNPRDLLR